MVKTGRDSISPFKVMLRYDMLHVEFLPAYRTCKDIHTRYSVHFPDIRPSDDSVDKMLLNKDFPLLEPFKALCKALGHESESQTEELAEDSNEGPSSKRRKLNPQYPLVVLAFDEVYTLAKTEDNGTWSRFIEMRRAIRGLRTFPLFTLFLSTSGTLFGITPSPGRDL